MSDLASFAARSPTLVEAFDATTPEFTAYASEVERWYEEAARPYVALDGDIRSTLDAGSALGLRTALKFAESRRIIRSIREPLTVTLLNPVYKETGRMRPRSEHPHGEDSLRTKVETLRNLTALNPLVTGRLIVIDDECPDGSGHLAEEILTSTGSDVDSRVLFLGEAIDAGDPLLPPGVTHKDGPRRSVKGGSVLYGMRAALADAVDGRHVIVDNDADLSVHPIQLGLLLEPIVIGTASVVAGSRREPDSVATIGAGRNVRGRLFIQIWQRLLPELATVITDTNRAFKAFDASALGRIIDRVETFTFPYQVEVLQASISARIPLTPRGIAYLDSEAASTQSGEAITETYLHQIHQIVNIARRYHAIDADDRLAAFLEGTTETEWAAIEADPPDDIDDLAR